MKHAIIFYCILSHYIILGYVEITKDYFDAKFDKSRNCKHEELMRQLAKEQLRCSSSSSSVSDVHQWEECKRSLSTKLISTCPNTKILKVK